MNQINFPYVKVVWTDAESFDDWEEIGEKYSCKPITTIGHLIEDAEEHIVVAMNLDLANKSISMVMVIPNYWIESVEFLQIV